MEIITQDAYDQHWQNCFKANGEIAYHINGVDKIGCCRNRYSTDQFWLIQLQSGLRLHWVDDHYHRDVFVKSEHEDDMPLVVKFYLSGTHYVRCPGIPHVPAEYCETAGQSYFFALPDIK